MITASSQDRILTNQLLLDELELWNLFDSKSIDDDQTQRYYQLIDDLLDSQIGESIAWLQSDDAKEYFFEQVGLQKEIFDALEDEWDNILNQSYSSVDELLDEIYETGKEKGYENIRETLRYTDADKEAIRIAKDYNFHLIRKLDNDLRGTVKNKILKGIISGENPYNLAKTLVDAGVQQLDGSTFTPRQRATMIAKTETSRMQNTGMLQSYINEGYTEVKILTAEDDHVCTTCLEYAYNFNNDEPRIFSPELLERERIHNIIKLIKGGLFPPFHVNCRCTYLTVWKSKTDPPENPPIINLTPLVINNFINDNQNDSNSIRSLGNIVKKFRNKINKNVPESIANKFNLTYESKVEYHTFKDKIHDCEIIIPKVLCEGENSIISVNGSHGYISLFDIIKAYSQSLDSMKLATKNIVFLNKSSPKEGRRKNALAYHTLDGNDSNIYIFSKSSLWYPSELGLDFQRQLLHEMGHAQDLNPIHGLHLSTKENLSQFEDFGINSSEGAFEANDNQKYEEVIADALSMVVYKNIPKSTATIKVPKFDENGKHVGYEVLGYDEWHERFNDLAVWLEKELNL